VVEGGDDDVVADQASVADADSSLVLEPASRVDEHSPAHPDVLSTVGGEGWEQREIVGHVGPDEPGEQPAQLGGFVVAPVDLRAHPQGVLRECVDQREDLVAGPHRLPRGHASPETFDFLGAAHRRRLSLGSFPGCQVTARVPGHPPDRS